MHLCDALLKSCCSSCCTPHLCPESGREWSCAAVVYIPCLKSCPWWGPNRNRPAAGSLPLNANILGMNVSVCIMQCVHYAPLSCKPLGTKSCITGFQASTRAVNENLVSFNSWVLAGCTREMKTLSIAMPTCLLLMPSSKDLCWLAAVTVLLNTERNLKKCFLCWHTD